MAGQGGGRDWEEGEEEEHRGRGGGGRGYKTPQRSLYNQIEGDSYAGNDQDDQRPSSIMMSLQSNVVDVNIIMMVPVHGVDEYHDDNNSGAPITPSL